MCDTTFPVAVCFYVANKIFVFSTEYDITNSRTVLLKTGQIYYKLPYIMSLHLIWLHIFYIFCLKILMFLKNVC